MSDENEYDLKPGEIMTANPADLSIEGRAVLRARYNAGVCLQCGKGLEDHAPECPAIA
jgi:hypothetical protein